MTEQIVQLNEEFGLDARLSALVSLLAQNFESKIIFVKDSKQYDAKSIMAVIMIGAVKGDRIVIRADGPDEVMAVNILISTFTIQNKQRIEELLNKIKDECQDHTLKEDDFDQLKKEFEALDDIQDKIRNDSIDSITGAFGEFGYERTNPVPVNDPSGERLYIEGLQCECGVPFLYRRIGNVGMGPDGHFLDMYTLVCKNFKHKIDLYFDMYHGSQSGLVPTGLTKGDNRGSSVEDYLKIFPTDLEKIEKHFHKDK